MGGKRLESREENLGLLAGELQPEGIGAKVDFAGRLECAPLIRDAGALKNGVIVPRGKYAAAGLRREIGFAFDAVVKTEPDMVAVENLDVGDGFPEVERRWNERLGTCFVDVDQHFRGEEYWESHSGMRFRATSRGMR